MFNPQETCQNEAFRVLFYTNRLAKALGLTCPGTSGSPGQGMPLVATALLRKTVLPRRAIQSEKGCG